MKKKIDIHKWKRREIYRFFKDYDEPYYGITVDLECTAAYEYAKSNKISFFLYYLYLVLKAVNQTDLHDRNLVYRCMGNPKPLAITQSGADVTAVQIATVNQAVFHERRVEYTANSVARSPFPGDRGRAAIVPNANQPALSAVSHQKQVVAHQSRYGDRHGGKRLDRYGPVKFARFRVQATDGVAMPDQQMPLAVDFVDHRRRVTGLFRS